MWERKGGGEGGETEAEYGEVELQSMYVLVEWTGDMP